jgi:multiple sugar transport system substrate-binding protein
MSRRRAVLALGALALGGGACRPREEESGGPLRVVFKHQPLGDDPGPLRRLIAGFEREHPGVEIAAELLPNAPGAVHQYLLTALEGEARELDVFVVDVIWVAEFARAGWIADLAPAFPREKVRQAFLPGPAEAVLVQGGTFAVPWYADVGVLYRRADLVPDAPTTYAELVERAARAASRRAGVHGYVWQGLQSEALVCNVYEAIWGHGGASMRDGRVLLDTPEASAALEGLRALLTRRISPPSVTSMGEEESRRVFQAGGAAFMRNWPYAFAEAQRPGSPVRGRVSLSALPSTTGALGPGALGGYQLALSAHTPASKVEAARRFIAHLTSPQANLVLALSYGRSPSRRAIYDDPRLRERAPMIADLLPLLERARPRPVTPFYPMFADTLAAEFSAAITGVRSPTAALRRAQLEVDHLMEELG